MAVPLAPVDSAGRRRPSRAVVVRRAVAALVAGTSLLVGLGAGGAYAYWRSSGTGSGTASVGSPLAVTVVAATAAPTTKLIPGTSADLVVQLDNPNAYAVTIVGIAQNGTAQPVGASGPGVACTDANTGVSVPTQSGLAVTVASGSGITVHLPNGVAMATTSASGCQGATFQIPVLVTVQR